MTIQTTILVVEDDRETSRLLRTYLVDAGYTVFAAYDGEQALHTLNRERPNLVLLDIMLPDRDGWEITQYIRRSDALRHTPILMLTARVEDYDKILGLELGADEYVTKPFNPRVVLAHVRALLRRSDRQHDTAETSVLQYETLRLDPYTRQVHVNGVEIELTPTEFDLLKTLMSSIGHVFTRAELIEQALSFEYNSLERSLDTHIMNLRKKIGAEADNEKYIETVYSVGYRLGRRR
jgi:two-component system alkaline phosphatase synthesis response regulator PhoP